MDYTPDIYYMAAITSQDAGSRRRAELGIQACRAYGPVLSDHIIRDDVAAWERENVRNGVSICDRDMQWLNDIDYAVADITTGSTGVGVEVLHTAAVLNKPVLALHPPEAGSKMVWQLRHPRLTVREYASDEEYVARIHEYCREFRPEHRLHDRLVVYDMIDGAGKGVIGEAIDEWARANGMPVFDSVAFAQQHKRSPTWEDAQRETPGCRFVHVAEPSWADTGAVVRDTLIRNGNNYPVDAIAHGYSLDRLIQDRNLVLPALEAGAFVASDRSWSTSFVYQPVQAAKSHGYSHQFFRGLVCGLPGNRAQLQRVPGLFIIPQLSTDVAIARLDAREKKDNAIFEEPDFLQRAALVYGTQEFRRPYTRRGTRVVDLFVEDKEQRDVTKQKARAIWESYVAHKGLQ